MTFEENPEKVDKPHKRGAGDYGEDTEDYPEDILSRNTVYHAANRIEYFD